MRMSFLSASVLSVVIILAGCGGTTSSKPGTTGGLASGKTDPAAIEKQKPQPEWVTGESKKYPRIQYLTARSSGGSADEAIKLAKEKLSSLFVVNLNDYDMPAEQAKLAADYEIIQINLSNDQPTAASPKIDRVLKNIEIGDQWHNISNNSYHVLVVVPRNISEGYLRNQIQTLDTNTEAYINEARTNTDPLTKTGFMSKAWRSQQFRTSLQKSMRKIDLTARGIDPKWNFELIQKDVDSLISNLQIFPTGLENEPNAREMTKMLMGGMKAGSLKPANEKTADYVLRGVLEASIIGERNGWAVGHGTVKLVLADNVTGRVRASRQFEFESPGLNENAAYRRVNEKAEYLFKRDLRNLIIDMSMQ